MTFTDSTRHSHTDSYISDLAPKAKPTRKSRAKKQVNYRSADRKGTLTKQASIRELLSSGIPFSVRAVGQALGISRQLALYHVKKMAAKGELVMMLEPCERNGGLQFKVWDETALMAFYVSRAQRLLRSAVIGRAA